jgi:hypothetical protein
VKFAYLIKLLAIMISLAMMSCSSPSSMSHATTSQPPVISGTNTILQEITTSKPVPSSQTLPQPTITSAQPLITVSKEVHVTVSSNGYIPNLIYAPIGTIVIWQSSEPRFQGCCPRCHINHTVTSETGVFDSGVLSVFAHYFGKAGNYVYYDSLYPELTGTVIIGTDINATQSEPNPEHAFQRTGGGGLVGSVIFADDTPKSENTAWLFPSNNLDIAYASANIKSDGHFTFNNIPTGTYVIYITWMSGNSPFFFSASREFTSIIENSITTAEDIFIPRLG